jgi:hypothetical protein
MANANAPFGLRPVRDGSNRPWSGGGNTYYVEAAHSGALYIGDPVIVTGASDAAGVPAVDIATAGATNYWTGAIVGFVPDPTIVANGFLPTLTAGYVIVADDPNIQWAIQTTTLASADLEANSVLHSGTGSRITGSGWYLDTGTKGTSNTYQARITGVWQAPNNALGTYCVALVRNNLPTEMGLPTGTGF